MPRGHPPFPSNILAAFKMITNVFVKWILPNPIDAGHASNHLDEVANIWMLKMFRTRLSVEKTEKPDL